MNYDDLLTNLKKLQRLEPDARFTAQSRALVLSKTARKNAWGVILEHLELGASLALAGVLIVAILGGLSSWKLLAPFHASNLDTAGLKAEAQAVDAQIELTNLTYQSYAAPAAPATEKPQAFSHTSPAIKKPAEKPSALSTPSSEENTSTIKTLLNVDDALLLLSK